MMLRTLMLLPLAAAFAPARPATRGQVAMMAQEGGVSRRELSQSIQRGVLGAVVAPAIVTLAGAAPALATDRPAFKAMYFRYTPRIESGTRWFAVELGSAVDSGDWAKVTKYFDQTLDNPKKKERSSSSSTYERDFARPMNLLAGSFAEKGVGAKKDSMLAALSEFGVAMNKLEGAARGFSGKKSGGFLGFFAKEEPDVLKGRPQGAVAKEAYAEAKKALLKYIDLTNDSLDFDLKKLEYN